MVELAYEVELPPGRPGSGRSSAQCCSGHGGGSLECTESAGFEAETKPRDFTHTGRDLENVLEAARQTKWGLPYIPNTSTDSSSTELFKTEKKMPSSRLFQAVHRRKETLPSSRGEFHFTKPRRLADINNLSCASMARSVCGWVSKKRGLQGRISSVGGNTTHGQPSPSVYAGPMEGASAALWQIASSPPSTARATSATSTTTCCSAAMWRRNAATNFTSCVAGLESVSKSGFELVGSRTIDR
jgi:hypothetical protein